MKKILLTILMVTMMSLHTPAIYAQEEMTETEETTTTIEEAIEEAETLADTLDSTSETVEEESLSFGTILVATLTPALFIIICYMLIKFFKQQNI